MENNGKSKGVINSTRKELNNLAKSADLNKPDDLTATESTIEQAIPPIEQGYIRAAEFNGIKIFKKPQ